MLNTIDREALLELERGFWHQGEAYYQEHLSQDCTFVFPGMIMSRLGSIQALSQAPRWQSVDITNATVTAVSDTVILLTYHATATREDDSIYQANLSSLYVMEGTDLKLMFHQQTPDPDPQNT